MQTFHAEGPQYYRAALARNLPFAQGTPHMTHWGQPVTWTAGNYNTPLNPQQEQAFRVWVKQNGVPFNPNARIADYDMRGYWKATGGRGWKPGMHFPDTFKTPYDTTFSRQSKYATPNNPFIWKGNNLIDRRTGAIAFSPGQQQQMELPAAILAALVSRPG